MQDASSEVTAVPLPAHGRIAGFYATTHLADVWCVPRQVAALHEGA